MRECCYCKSVLLVPKKSRELVEKIGIDLRMLCKIDELRIKYRSEEMRNLPGSLLINNISSQDTVIALLYE